MDMSNRMRISTVIAVVGFSLLVGGTVLAADGDIDTVAGDGSAATAASLSDPIGVHVVGGRLLIADQDNHRLRAVDLGSGIIETIAGTGVDGSGPDGLDALATDLHEPFDVIADDGLAVYWSEGSVTARRGTLFAASTRSPT